jgi:hypothetical protein
MQGMMQFIGVKIVKARPMTEGEAAESGIKPCQSGLEDRQGYKVEYEDGYISWCPKHTFEHANRRCDAMTFGHAIEAMKLGKKIKLPRWQEDVFISIQTPDENSKMTAPYFYVTSRFGLVPWIPTMIEMFSEDWQIIQ